MSRILISVIFLISFSLSNANAQAWVQELEKYEGEKIREIESKMEAFFDKIGRDKASKYKHYQRWVNDARNHTNAEGFRFNHAAKNQDFLRHMEKTMSTNGSGNRHFHGSWTSMNPANFQTPNNAVPVMGRVNCMAKPPSNSNIIYVGAATGGIWKSYNNGSTWTPLMDGMVQLGVSSIVIDYTNENHIVILTGDGDFRNMPSSGVFQSFDAGQTWECAYEFPLSDVVYCTKMIQSKADPNDYFFGIRGSDAQAGIRRLSLAPSPVLNMELSTPYVFDIEYKPGTTNTLYASSTSGIHRKDPLYNWTLMNSNGNFSGLPSGGFDRTQVAVCASDPNIVYNLNVKTIGQNYFFSLYKSIDGGFVFTLQVDDNYPINLVGIQAASDLVLEVDPNNCGVVYIGGQNLYRSTNSGASWVVQSTGLHADMHNLYYFGNEMYVCTDGGLSRKTLAATNWTSINNGLQITQFYNIDIDGNRFLGGTQDNGTMYWDLGDAVGLRIISADGFDCLFDKNDPNTIYASNQVKRKKSVDSGNSFIDLHNNKYKGPIKHWVGDSDKIISTEENIHVSLDNGVTWQNPINPFAPQTERTIGFSQSPLYPNTIYVNSFDRVMKSTNFGDLESATWTDVTGNLPANLEARDIVVHPINPDLVYICRAGYQSEQIYYSYTGGGTWFPWSTGISQLPVYSMTYDSQNGNAFYVGTELGVFYRKTGFPEWIPFSNYLPKVPVQEIVINNTFVYAATYGRGLWRSAGYTNCFANVTLTQTNDPTNGDPSGFQIHKASNILTSSRIIQGGAGTDVKYQAGNYIDLYQGFHSKGGTLIKTGGCTE